MVGLAEFAGLKRKRMANCLLFRFLIETDFVNCTKQAACFVQLYSPGFDFFNRNWASWPF